MRKRCSSVSIASRKMQDDSEKLLNMEGKCLVTDRLGACLLVA